MLMPLRRLAAGPKVSSSLEAIMQESGQKFIDTVRKAQPVMAIVDTFIAALDNALSGGSFPGVAFATQNEIPVRARLSAWGCSFDIAFKFAEFRGHPRGVIKVGTSSTQHVPTAPLFHWFIDEHGNVLEAPDSASAMYNLSETRTVGRFLDKLADLYIEKQASCT